MKPRSRANHEKSRFKHDNNASAFARALSWRPSSCGSRLNVSLTRLLELFQMLVPRQ